MQQRNAGATVIRRLSGLQRQVLALYRDLWRTAMRRPHESVATRDALLAHIRSSFKQGATTLRRADVDAIEARIRHGRKRLELLQRPGTDTVSFLQLNSNSNTQPHNT
eukprot:TRINITY_DN9165_c0_g1_i1.p1 TRINITY_DN9165_c0_g1~~TRINITY_DN9165_c0_g1_i1.p1  ORF type:complete len:121 (-),score=27.12 TRINITY_DN9165_c0_g1_i1:59-382(-)